MKLEEESSSSMSSSQGMESVSPRLIYPVTSEGEPKHWNKAARALQDYWLTTCYFFVALEASLILVTFTLFAFFEGDIFFTGVMVVVDLVFYFGFYFLLRSLFARGYEVYGFAFTQQHIYMRQGIYYTKNTVINYGQVQDVSFTQGMMEKHYGIFTVHIQTAGSSTTEGLISGIREPVAFSEFIMSKARAARTQTPSLLAQREEDPASCFSPDARAILEELRGMNQMLREAKGRKNDQKDLQLSTPPRLRNKTPLQLTDLGSSPGAPSNTEES